MSDDVNRMDEMELDQTPEKAAEKSKPAAKAKAAKSSKQKKQGDQKVRRYLRELKGEFKKIIWPSRSTLVRNTTVTLIMCVFMGAIICLFDLGLGGLINLLMKLK